MKVTQTVFWERRHIVSKLTTTANIVSIRLLPSEKKLILVLARFLVSQLRHYLAFFGER